MHILAREREKPLLKQKCVVIGTKKGITFKDKNYKHLLLRNAPSHANSVFLLVSTRK